ncbi:MAG: FAD-dependent oxidoreductase, partial [Candidatus Bipolaricaulota bacterium]
MKSKLYDVAIIGGGPAAHSAALYARRKELKTAMISKEEGGQVLYSSEIDNYLGIPDVEGFELVKKFRNHVDKYKPDRVEEEVKGIDKSENEFTLKLGNGDTLNSKTLVLATGAKWRKLGVPGEEELSGKGVSYCTTCDGPLYADSDVAVIGGGNSAFEGIIDLLPIANRIVNVDIAPEPIADPVLQRHVNESDHLEEVELEQYYGHEILEILGDGMVSGLRIKDKETGEEKEIEVEGVFVEIGLIPNSGIVEDMVETNDAGEIVVDCNNQTTVGGLFAAG